MKIKFSFLILLLSFCQGCLIYPWITVEDPGFELQFVDKQNKAVPNLDFHYMLSRRSSAYYIVEKHKTFSTDSNGIVKLPKKRTIETMFLHPHASHSTRSHIWTWCVSDKNYLPQTGVFKLNENEKKITLENSRNDYQCLENTYIGYLDVVCSKKEYPNNEYNTKNYTNEKDTQSQKDCPELDIVDLEYIRRFNGTLTPEQIKDALDSIRSGKGAN